MNQTSLNKLLLKTAFACMACDGDIDKREVGLIKTMHKDRKIFGDIEIGEELDELLRSIKHDAHQFLKGFFHELSTGDLLEEEELKLVEVAIETIKADEKVEYSEIKFFKVIRSKLKIEDDPILLIHPDFEEYLEQDVLSDSYLSKLQDDYFDVHKTLINDVTETMHLIKKEID